MTLAIDTSTAQGSIMGRALELLGSGVPQESVASALGVTPSYISQLLSDEAFAGAVTTLKYEVLSKHTERDATYDKLEDKLLAKLDKSMALMFKPMDIVRALQTVNNANRRGHDSKESIITQQNIVEITMPTQIVNQFTTNITNQVITVGDQDLTTIQSTELLRQVEGDKQVLQHQDTKEDIPNQEPKLLESDTILSKL